MRTTSWPLFSVEVTVNGFLPHFALLIVDGRVVAGSHEAVAWAIFRDNRNVRPRIRGLRNPTRAARRTDFGRRGGTGTTARSGT